MSRLPATLEEELIRESAELPVMRDDLRNRVLVAAHRTYRRRLMLREGLGVAMILTVTVWVVGSNREVLLPGPPRAGRVAQSGFLADESDQHSPGNPFAQQAGVVNSPETGDWEQVDAQSQDRQRRIDVLRAAF